MVVWLLPSSSSLPQQPLLSFCPSYKLALRKCNREIRQNCTKRPQVLPLANGETVAGLRLFVLSDLHTDYSENMTWVKSLSTTRHKKDVLLVAGDVAETCKKFIQTMSSLKDRFEHVFYVPGNHDLWCRWEKDDYPDSLEKLNKLLEACRRIGVETNPMVVDGLGIVPLFSWYHKSFDREEDITGIRIPALEMISSWPDIPLRLAKRWPVEGADIAVEESSMVDRLSFLKRCLVGRLSGYDKELPSALVFMASQLTSKACKDFHACKWPKELLKEDASLALYFDVMNNKNEDAINEIQQTCSQIISFSHFVPRQELCPEKRMLFYPNLPKIIGSDFLEVSIRSIHQVAGSSSACHVFGHTHFCWDAVLDGIRYVQAPLAYPRERRRRMNGGEDWLPYCIYSGGQFTERLSPCYWSDYYFENPRTPHMMQLAPWVARFYRQSP
ncbi:hypothetical protein RJ639_033511 [Escallonia herrerae]|uniref:Calcineurin-like phosphoesterase domain-containing protein n=1 Tax=Escallonia herrerae TaxID=1293975 RepID=A0AA88WXS7_9ASTE|nr:hypothetical protein RJ639_033511 [Escallonia herrerae]